ncbi:HEAT repeat domain-containing protein [Geochorda subterranea]|uniref:HEAT repeat protein n=1 Tax=Geochorda subterranea TaxID=3109564 RepID=A0ABZ1BS76_9FIRM|nr:hypothetical protein [Limnochorda sp. LNt]WRP15316.1 hypothetical protein VLY81_03890 [Limnochorda sp. LNt]
MAEAARGAFRGSVDDEQERLQARDGHHGFVDVVRLLAQAAGPELAEGWAGVPERLAPLLDRDAAVARQLMQDPDRGVRRLAVMALAGVSSPWVLDLLSLGMEDPVPEIRALAAESADRWLSSHPGAGTPPAQLVERVLALVEDPCEDVRLSVVGPVVRLGREEGVRSLLAVFERTDDELMRGEILGALAAAGYNAEVARLAGAIRSGELASPYLRRILARLDGQATPALYPHGQDGADGTWGDGWAAEGVDGVAGDGGP